MSDCFCEVTVQISRGLLFNELTVHSYLGFFLGEIAVQIDGGVNLLRPSAQD